MSKRAIIQGLCLFFPTLLIHIYFSWSIPNDGGFLAEIELGLLIISLLFLFLFHNSEKWMFLFLRNISAALFTLYCFHLACGEYARKTWPLNQLMNEIEINCSNDECDYSCGILYEYTFPVIQQTVEYYTYDGYIGIFYNTGRAAYFDWDGKLLSVD